MMFSLTAGSVIQVAVVGMGVKEKLRRQIITLAWSYINLKSKIKGHQMNPPNIDHRQLDLEVAEKVMGLDTTAEGGWSLVSWQPSSNIIQAWQVMEKLADADPQITQWGEDDGSWTWWVDFEGTNTPPEDSWESPLGHRNIATAICLAAIKYLDA